MKRNTGVLTVLIALCMVATMVNAQTVTSIGEINQVDDQGNPVFAGLQTTDKYTIEGVAVNSTGAFNGMNDDGSMATDFIVFVQDETGGMQVYSGGWYGGGMALYPEIKQGDRIRATGLTGHFGGKTNMNDRHNPDQKFEITVLSSGEEIKPIAIDNLAGINDFDPTRATGGEYYQGRLVELKNVEIIEGEWLNGSMLTVADGQGNTFTVELRHGAKIADSAQPQGLLNIVGVFDQEDPEAPFMEGYLLWPRSITDFTAADGSSQVDEWNLYK